MQYIIYFLVGDGLYRVSCKVAKYLGRDNAVLLPDRSGFWGGQGVKTRKTGYRSKGWMDIALDICCKTVAVSVLFILKYDIIKKPITITSYKKHTLFSRSSYYHDYWFYQHSVPYTVQGTFWTPCDNFYYRIVTPGK